MSLISADCLRVLLALRDPSTNSLSDCVPSSCKNRLSVCLFVLRPDSICPFSQPHCSICCSCIKQPGRRSPASGWLRNWLRAAQRLTANLQKNKEATVLQRDGLKMRGTQRRGKKGRRRLEREKGRERAAKWRAAG